MGEQSLAISICLVVSVAACGPVSVWSRQTNQAPPPSRAKVPEAVDVYLGKAPDRAYAEAGVITATSNSFAGTGRLSDLVQSIQTEAGKLGCDGVILLDDSMVSPLGQASCWPWKATCIVYTSKGPAKTYKKKGKKKKKSKVATKIVGRIDLPPGFEPYMYLGLWEEFESNAAHAAECLAEKEWDSRVTVAIDVAPDGSLKEWGCKEEGLKKTPECECILEPFIGERTYWPTETGFIFAHIYTKSELAGATSGAAADGVTPFMRSHLEAMFASSREQAVACLGDDGLSVPLTLSLQVDASGQVGSHSCDSEQEVSDEQCRCVLESVVGEAGLWSTPGGFEYSYAFPASAE